MTIFFKKVLFLKLVIFKGKVLYLYRYIDKANQLASTVTKF